MMESRELERRRGWPWKNRKTLSGLGGSSETGSSSAPVKLFDEEEVARILEDQVRIGDEQMMDALHEADLKHAEKEKTWSEKLAAAVAEITIKDNLVTQHIKVAEEAVVGWEKAESEAAEFKAELESVTTQRNEAEDRAKHLDGALNEIMQQLRGGREEHEKRLHDTIVKKTREFDQLRLAMEAQLTDVNKILSDNRTQLVESRAENEALNHALKDRSRMIAELNDVRAHAETDSKILRVRLEGLEKENVDLKCKVHSITKELEIRSAELEYGKKTSDVLSRQHAESLKRIVRLEDECNRLRVMVRKKLPNPAAIVRMKQELDALGKEAGHAGKPRRRPLIRSHGVGVDFLPVHELVLRQSQEDPVGREADAAQRMVNLDEETRMLKEALAKRNDELQQARIMCAKTASRLTAVEDELDALRAASPEVISHNNDASSSACSTSSVSVSESSNKRFPSEDGLHNKLDPLNDTERALLSRSQSESRLGFTMAESQEAAPTVNYGPALELENALEVANRMCEELSTKLTVAEDQVAALHSRNAANEQFVITLQERLDKLVESQEKADEQIPEAEVYEPEAPEINAWLQMELATAVTNLFQATEALARAVEVEPSPAIAMEDVDAPNGSIASSFHWQDPQLKNSMSTLAAAANQLLEGTQAHRTVSTFLSKLASTLACITGISGGISAKEHEAVCVGLESAKVQISQLEEAIHKLEEGRAGVKTAPEAVIERLQAEKVGALHRVSVVEAEVREAHARVEELKAQVAEAESLVAALQLQQDQQKREDELLEQELMELSSSGTTVTRVAEAELRELHAKMAALESELHGERRRHHDVVAKLEDLQEQIHRGVGRNTDDASVHSKELSQPFIGEVEASKSARQEREISAAALAECQRTILALGKQLKILGFSESRQLTLHATDSPGSIQRMTESMELLRWQTESGDQGPPRKISSSSVVVLTADGPVSVPASPVRSDLEAPSTPESPAPAAVVTRRSVRTVRPFQLPRASSGLSMGTRKHTADIR